MSYPLYEIEKEKTFNKVQIHELVNFDKNEDNIKVSIIIPVYNVEEYLKECLDSAVNQTLKEIEIICVNDGSTDNSLKILREYAENDKRIKIIDKDNSGYGHVMNIGMDMASGEYIGIIESDDYVLPEMYEKLYSVARENHLDFVKSDFYRFQKGETYFEKKLNKLVRKEEEYNTVLNTSKYHECFRFIMNTWCGIYKTDFLRKNLIRHFETPGASFQDNGFWFKANIYGKRTMYLKDAFYMNRRDNPNSSVNNSEKIYCANKEYALIYEFLEENNFKDEFLDAYNLKKFHNYMFTLDRIAPEYKEDYLKHISGEYNEIYNKGELYSKMFSDYETRRVKWIKDDPVSFYNDEYLERIKVSVILPVYNCERHLRECLDSLTNQTLKNIEIICVNDGSTDSSLEILKAYRAKYDNIKIINQENRGAGNARNRGMKEALGKYLSFLDADDFFENTMLEKAYNHSEKFETDICIFRAYIYDNITKNKEINTNAVKVKFLPRTDVFKSDDFDSNIFKDIRGWAWDKLYRREFVLKNNLEFQEIRTTNDMYFVFMSLLKAEKISLLDEALYYQRTNVSTSLSNTRELSWDCFYYALMKIKDEMIEMNIYEKYERPFVNYALLSCLWNFNTLREPSARKLFDKLRDEWFLSLGITGHERKFFENENEYNQFNEIMNIPLDDSDAYNTYRINSLKTAQPDVMEMKVKIKEHETLTVRELIEKLEWYRNRYN